MQNSELKKAGAKTPAFLYSRRIFCSEVEIPIKSQGVRRDVFDLGNAIISTLPKRARMPDMRFEYSLWGYAALHRMRKECVSKPDPPLQPLRKPADRGLYLLRLFPPPIPLLRRPE